jgi:hypothetical protein
MALDVIKLKQAESKSHSILAEFRSLAVFLATDQKKRHKAFLHLRITKSLKFNLWPNEMA